MNRHTAVVGRDAASSALVVELARALLSFPPMLAIQRGRPVPYSASARAPRRNAMTTNIPAEGRRGGLALAALVPSEISLPRVALQDTIESSTSGRAPLDDDPVEDPSGGVRRLGRYVILEPVGASARSHVYAAYDPHSGRRVAIKHLERVDAKRRARLEQAARSLVALSHPNLVGVLDAGGDRADELFLVMEFVEGMSLSRWLLRRGHDRSWRAILRRFIQAGRGLEAAHAAGLVHGALTLRRILVTGDGRAKVSGLIGARARADARSMTADEAGNPAREREVELDLTETIDPELLAPEQRRGLPPDERADVYQLCLALRDALDEHEPPRDKTSSARRRRAPRHRPEPTPIWLRRHIARGLEEDPARRWPSMTALLRALERDPARARTRRRRAAAVVGALAGVAATTAWFEQRSVERCVATNSLETTWNDVARASIEQAFSASRADGHATSWRRVERRLDHWARRWGDELDSSCRDRRLLSASADRYDRASCLEDRRDRFVDLVKVLSEADRAVVAHAVEVTDSLAPPSLCRDPAWLAAHATTRREDERVTLETLLPRLEFYARSGQYARGLRLIGPLLESDDDHVRAEALRLAGELEAAVGRPQDAERRLHAAWLLALQLHDDRAAAETASRLAAHYARDRERSARWRALADVMFARAGLLEHPAAVEHHLRLAALADADSRPDEASARRHAALEQLERALGPEAPRVAELRRALDE